MQLMDVPRQSVLHARLPHTICGKNTGFGEARAISAEELKMVLLQLILLEEGLGVDKGWVVVDQKPFVGAVRVVDLQILAELIGAP